MTQLSLLSFAALASQPIAAAPAPAFLPDGSPLLEARVRCLPLWWDFAWLVMAGIKTLETRSWMWGKHPPSWVAIYASLGRGNLAERPLLPFGIEIPKDAPRGALVGLIWIPGSRPLVEADTVAACFPFGPGRHAFPIGARRPFKVPVPLAESGLKKGPQSLVYLARSVVQRSLS